MRLFMNKKGSVTVFLSLIMSGVLFFTAIMVDASKIIGAKSIVSGAGNMALYAGLTNYNTVLQDTYGIFAVSKDEKELEKNLAEYFRATLESNGLESVGLASELVSFILSDGDVSELIDLKMEGFKAQGVSGSSLDYPDVLRSQILDYSKYRAPVVLGHGFLEKLNILQTLPKQQEVLASKAKYEKELKKTEDLCKEVYLRAKSYEDYLTVIESPYSAPISPDDIMAFGLKQANQWYPILTKSVIVHVVLESWQSNKSWNQPSEKQNTKSSFDDSRNQFESMSGEQQKELHYLYEELDKIESNEEAWKGFKTAYQYYVYYFNNIDMFQDVHQQYKDEKQKYENEINGLKQDIKDWNAERDHGEDADNSDIDEAIADIRTEIKRLEAEWKIKDNWYRNEFQQLGKTYDWNNVKSKYTDKLSKYVTFIGDYLYDQINGYYSWAEELETRALSAIQKLKELEAAVEHLNDLSDIWGENIDALGTSDIQSSMLLEHDNKAKALRVEDIVATIEILERGLQYAQDIKAELAAIEYVSHKIVGGSTDWPLLVYRAVQQEWRGTPPFETNEQIAQFQEVLHNEKNFYKVIDESAQNRIYSVQNQARSNADLELWGYIQLDGAGGTDRLYGFLERTVKIGEVDEGKKAEEKQKQSEMRAEADKQEVALDSLPSEGVPHIMKGEKAAKTATTGEVKKTDDAGDVVDSAVDTTGKALNQFNLASLGEVLVSGRDKLYLMTYATNMFSCYTTKPEGETTMTNIVLNGTNNQLFRAEQEYILWGNDNAQMNIAATQGTIFGIRLLLNIIYAYTGDPMLKAQTLTMATAIAGWTGFGVPIVQNALLIAAALAETAYDVNQLMKGESVPLYKTNGTWVFRFDNLAKKTVSTAMKTAMEKASTKLYEEMNKLTDSMTDGFQEELDKYIANTIDNTVNLAISSVQAPIMEVLLWAAAYIEEVEGNLEAELRKKIEDCFSGMEQVFQEELASSGTAGSILAEMKLLALSFYNTSANKDALVEMMMNASTIRDVVNETRTLTDKVEAWFANSIVEITDRLKAEVEATGITKALNDEIKEILSEGNKNAQEAINKKLNEFMGKMGSNTTSGSSAVSDGMFKDFDSTSASTFSMDYQEYLMVFLVIQFLPPTGEQAALARMGNLMQANAKKEASAYYAGTDFMFEKAFTMIQVESEASVKPTFISIPDFKTDWSAPNNERYSIPYKGVLGY